MIKAKFLALLAVVVCTNFIKEAVSQQIFSSGAAAQVGASCSITVYYKPDDLDNSCRYCNEVKAGLASQGSQPPLAGCLSVTKVEGALSGTYGGVKWPGGSGYGTAGIDAALAYCSSQCYQQVQSPTTTAPSKPQLPSTSPSEPNCSGSTPFKCGTICCSRRCDPRNSNSCLQCLPYRKCGTQGNNCKAGETCENKLDESGCPEDFECSAPPTPVCNGEECRDPNSPAVPESLFDPIIDPFTTPPAEPPASPAPEAPVQSPDDCLTDKCGADQICCKATQACGPDGQCRSYTGCANCADNQVCKPTNVGPHYYNCVDVQSGTK
jgi:hypothetical protein